MEAARTFSTQQRSFAFCFSIVCVAKFEERGRCVIADAVAFDSASKEKREGKSIKHFSRRRRSWGATDERGMCHFAGHGRIPREECSRNCFIDDS